MQTIIEQNIRIIGTLSTEHSGGTPDADRRLDGRGCRVEPGESGACAEPTWTIDWRVPWAPPGIGAESAVGTIVFWLIMLFVLVGFFQALELPVVSAPAQPAAGAGPRLPAAPARRGVLARARLGRRDRSLRRLVTRRAGRDGHRPPLERHGWRRGRPARRIARGARLRVDRRHERSRDAPDRVSLADDAGRRRLLAGLPALPARHPGTPSSSAASSRPCR